MELRCHIIQSLLSLNNKKGVFLVQQHEYQSMINKNTIRCWSIIAIVLFISYIFEIMKGSRTIEYVACFSVAMIVPLMLACWVYKKNTSSQYVKIIFAIGYSIFYTFVVLTTQSPAAFVYILPMASILMSYCNNILIISVFGYALIINLANICISIANKRYLFLTNFKEFMTFWEIQIACLMLTGLFLYLSTKLLIIRNTIINDIVDDVYTDALTGLKNVRFIDKNIDSTLAFDKNSHLAIAFIDIDNFKQFNTNYGHSFGDTVLQTLGDILLKNTKQYKHTYAVRNGGDEFLIVSRMLDDERFICLMDDICSQISEFELKYKEENDIHITVSIGVSTKQHDNKDCQSFRDLYNKADNRNQKAKNAGKNIVIHND